MTDIISFIYSFDEIRRRSPLMASEMLSTMLRRETNIEVINNYIYAQSRRGRYGLRRKLRNIASINMYQGTILWYFPNIMEDIPEAKSICELIEEVVDSFLYGVIGLEKKENVRKIPISEDLINLVAMFREVFKAPEEETSKTIPVAQPQGTILQKRKKRIRILL